MKKFVSGFILAVVVTPAIAKNEVDAPSTVKSSSYTLEVKEGEQILSTLNFAAIDSETTKVASWDVQSHLSKNSNSTEIYKVKTGFGMTLIPDLNRENFIGISFEYRQPLNQNKPKQPIYTFETGSVLAKGGTFCSDLSGTGEKVGFCLSRN